MRWSSFQWWTSLCWSYLLYDSRSTFRSQCSEGISAYARLVKFNPSILHVQNWLAPVVCERRAYHTWSSRGVSARRTVAMVHTQGEHATAVLSKIRCIKDKHHMQSKICDMIWPSSSCAFDLHLQRIVMVSSSPAWHHDLHHLDLYQCVVTWSSRQLLLYDYC